MTTYVCVHGHFYQPPRENPWLEAIEPQDSAAPYHDWNQRISVECYEPNTASRILDDEDQIVSIVNNYSRMSFNFGATLLSWLEREQPSVYAAILNADRQSLTRFGGHGSALAQGYSHIILPLATREEKEIQVSWGLRDFEARFGREAEGLWLPETAVDVETLEVLAAHDVRFTILAPSQAARVRSVGESDWRDVSGGRIDPRRPYLHRLPSGKTIALFFYDGGLSRGVAFDGLLHRGEEFARRLANAGYEETQPHDDADTLVHIATDGESYGHHHPHGDMALAYALHALETRAWAKLTNYGEFLEHFPPTHEVEIFENSSWSCAHGVERWRSDCGCHTGGPGGWTQAWRAPLRAALDWLRARAHEITRDAGERLFKSPDDAVARYIQIILDRSPDAVETFLSAHRKGRRSNSSDVRALKVLELHRQLHLMYTSCGWFFSDLAGIEAVQVLQYAGRAVQLAEDLNDASLEEGFLSRLAHARSNRNEGGSGRDIYERSVRPAKVTWEMIGAHYAMASFFETYPETTELYCYDVIRASYEVRERDKAKLAVGRALFTSRITLASEVMSFAVLYVDDHTVTTGVRRGARACDALEAAFSRGDEAEVSKALERCYGTHQFHLESLFGDERRRIVDALLLSTRQDAEASHASLFEKHGATMKFLAELGVPAPPALSVAAEVALNGELRRAFANEPLDADFIGGLLAEAITEGVRLDEVALGFVARQTLDHMAEQFFVDPADSTQLDRLRSGVRIALSMPFEVDLWRLQNLYYLCLRQDQCGDGRSESWREAFEDLGDLLSMRITEA